MMKIATALEAKKAGKFKCEPLQCLIAAQMVLNRNKFTLSLISAGSGKTFIIALLVLYFSECCNNSILVLTTSSFLEAQLDSELQSYLKGVDYNVCHFSVPIKYDDNLMVIVDEADEYVARNAA